MSGRRLAAWSDVERAVDGRPGWRRCGREWHGPCPLDGGGRDCCWAFEGAAAAVVVGCRRCGGRLDGPAVRAHLDALGVDLLGGAPGYAPGYARPAVSPRVSGAGAVRGQPRKANPAPMVWTAGETLPGLALAYLAGRVPTCKPPAGVRWLDADRARACRVRLPAAAAGCLLWAFTRPGDSLDAPRAVQLEALSRAGVQLAIGGAKRRSLAGTAGQWSGRTFNAGGEPGRGVFLAEGPVDALAAAALLRAGLLSAAARPAGGGDLSGFDRGAAVVGVPGVSFAQPAAVPDEAPRVVVGLDADGGGAAAALRLARALGGRAVVAFAAAGDWAETAAGFAADLDERAAIQGGG